MSTKKDLDRQIFLEEMLQNNYPVFTEKANFLFAEERIPGKNYVLVGYLEDEEELKELYDTKQLLVISDELID